MEGGGKGGDGRDMRRERERGTEREETGERGRELKFTINSFPEHECSRFYRFSPEEKSRFSSFYLTSLNSFR